MNTWIIENNYPEDWRVWNGTQLVATGEGWTPTLALINQYFPFDHPEKRILRMSAIITARAQPSPRPLL